jgi:outer membrane protein OmpA-like peptidoglycan-associated protein
MLGYTMPEKEVVVDTATDGDGTLGIDDASPDEPGAVENEAVPQEPRVIIEDSGLEILDKIYFNVDSAQLQRRSHAILDNVAEVLNAHPEITNIQVEGHTDPTGPAAYNMKLSQRRAESVVRYLVDVGGVSKERFIAEGFGETQLLVPGAKTKMELAQNRRVEFHIAEAGPEGGDPEGGDPEGGDPEGGDPEGGDPEGGDQETGEQ